MDSEPHPHSCPTAVLSPKSEYLNFLHHVPEVWTLAPGVRGHTAQPECPSHPPWEGGEVLKQRQQSVGRVAHPPPGQGRGGRRERRPLGGKPTGQPHLTFSCWYPVTSVIPLTSSKISWWKETSSREPQTNTDRQGPCRHRPEGQRQRLDRKVGHFPLFSLKHQAWAREGLSAEEATPDQLL